MTVHVLREYSWNFSYKKNIHRLFTGHLQYTCLPHAFLRDAFLCYGYSCCGYLRDAYLRYGHLRYGYLGYVSFRDGHLQNRIQYCHSALD